MILPNVSVSRKHAKIKLAGSEYQIENVSSKNEVLVNGQVVKEKILATGDEILIGKFTLIFFGDRLNPAQQLLEGRMLSEYPAYMVMASGPTDSTFQLSPAQVKRMREMMRRQRAAVVIRKDDTSQRWKPEDKPLSFGKKATVPVGGWFTGGTVATMEWAGTGHTLKKEGVGKVLVNGQSITEKMLQEGDDLTIGSTEFSYEFED